MITNEHNRGTNSFPNDVKLLNFRRRVEKSETGIPAPALDELERTAHRLVQYHLSAPKPLRPWALRRELIVLSRALRRSAKAIERMGKQGVLFVLASSGANREPEELDADRHIDYLSRFADYAERAHAAAKDMSDSAEDYRGGRTPDQRIRALVILLRERYEQLLSIEAKHTIDPKEGFSHSLFDVFVHDAITRFCPMPVPPEPRLIDDAISRALRRPATEPFDPPSIDAREND